MTEQSEIHASVAFVQEAVASQNLVENLSDAQLGEIGQDVIQYYDLDMESQSDWRSRMEKAIKLAKLVKEDKNYPFQNAANVKYPLITSAALQFNARAYPAIVASDRIVKTKTYGADPDGSKAARGERVSEHMSYQLSCEIEEWEEETDKLLVQLPIVGTMVRKVWYDVAQSRVRCRVIDAGDFVVNEKVKNLTDAPRASERLPLYPEEFIERVNAGLFSDVDLEQKDSEDNKAPIEFIEQHCRLDLDEDGYDEPYIVTVHVKSHKVVRIVADFEERDVQFETEQLVMESGVVEVPTGIKSIRRGSYFVPYHFLPSMDGGFHGTGLGLLLGDISESINSIINMLLNAGHMASLGGGFIGSELRLKGGAQRFRPGEWKQVPSTGGDIRNAINPITFPGPDATLFQMLGMLIEAGREIASVKDIMTGDSGERTQTATTTIALIEQGMMVFTAAYKRIFRALKKEFKLIAGINATAVSPQAYSQFHDIRDEMGQTILLDPAADYAMADMDIEPVADPRSVTKMQEAAKAQFLMQLAEAGLVNPQEASERMLSAMDIADKEKLAPQPDPMQEQMAQMQMALEQAKVEADGQKAAADSMKAEAEMLKAQTPVDNTVELLKLEANERTKAAEMAQEAQLAREKIAMEAQLKREEMANDLQARLLELQAQAATVREGDGQEQSQQEALAPIYEQFGRLILTLQAQMEMANAPKRVIRDDEGRVAGVEPVLN